MQVPESAERARVFPGKGIRGMFSGIGQSGLTADRPDQPVQSGRGTQQGRDRSRKRKSQRRDRDPRWPSLDLTNNVRLLSEEDVTESQPDPGPDSGDGPVPRPLPAITPTLRPSSTPRPIDPTNNVRLLPRLTTARAQDSDVPGHGRPLPAALAQPPSAAGAASVPAARPAGSGENGATRPAPPDRDAVEDLPIAGYDGLTVHALRARLRSLDPAQIRVLIDYERANAGRPDVVTMFERRISKLGAGRS